MYKTINYVESSEDGMNFLISKYKADNYEL